jgi:hypothetical protein
MKKIIALFIAGAFATSMIAQDAKKEAPAKKDEKKKEAPAKKDDKKAAPAKKEDKPKNN